MTATVDLSTIEIDIDKWDYVINESTYVRLVFVDETPKVDEIILPLEGVILELVENAGTENETRTTQSNIIGISQGACYITSIYTDLQGIRLSKNNYKQCSLTITYGDE